MHIVITEGAGFLGARLARTLLAGHQLSLAGGAPMGPLVRERLPFLWAHGAVLVMLTFWPALSTWAPHAMGFK